jgi:tripartite-type tricarboxylate transporter receptor subunit TctC
MNHLFRGVVIGLVVMAFAFGASQRSATAAEVVFPKKDGILTIIVPYNAGGSTDTEARVIASVLEKKIGIPVQISNKPGARTMVGLTALVSAKPDGYTLLLGSFPTVLVPCLDEKSQAAYTIKDFKTIAITTYEPFVIAVLKDSPYKSMKDLVDFARANPEKLKVAVTMVLAAPHLSILELEKQTNAKFAPVHFDGAAPSRTAFLGGHTDAIVFTVSEASQVSKAGLSQTLGIMDEMEDAHVPGVKTMLAQGYNLIMNSNSALLAPSKTPPEIINKLEELMKQVSEDPAYATKIAELGFSRKFKGVKDSEDYMNRLVIQIKPLVDEARKKEG